MAAESESDDLKSWLSTFEGQLDSKTFSCIYKTLKANQFSTRLKLKLIREEELNLMFQKELSLGAKALLSYQISQLREESPLQGKNREERIQFDGPRQNAGSKRVGSI